ncbi:MAG: CHAT domain-containing protein, partial [Leptolyngbya sp. SIO3F4]|nr:CHAT domain-containing protein [Leptolyngbya sp. SIO3F4]
SALYDGNSWLVENYTTNYITAASLTDFDDVGQPERLSVVAAAFSSNYALNPSGFPYYEEIEAIVSNDFLEADLLLNEQFSKETLQKTISLQDSSVILHLATPAALLPGNPRESFFLLGDGTRVTLRDLRNWDLSNVELLVLSGVETAVDGIFSGGEEILGLGYSFQNSGVRTVMTSLWNAADRSAPLMMLEFYSAFSRARLTKSEALRIAQLSLIERGLSHPYYWANFIIIGNGY